MKFSSLPFPVLACFLLICAPIACSHDHEDHTHPPADSELEPMRHTVFGNKLLLFLEHPPLIRAESVRFLAHFSILETGEPVREGRVQLALGDLRWEQNSPARDGLFIPAGAPPAAGRFPLKVTLATSGLQEEFDLGFVEVFENAKGVPPSSADSTGDSVDFLLEQQWKIGLLVRPATDGLIKVQRSFPAVLELEETAQACVSAGISGLLAGSGDQGLPRIGERVERNAPIASLEPLLNTVEATQLRVWELEAKLLEQQTRHELDLARSQLVQGERELARTHASKERGFATQAELDQAAGVVKEAQLHVAALEERVRVVVTREPTAGPMRVLVLAPIAGVVTETRAVLGQHVQAGDRLLFIADPRILRVRVTVPEESLSLFLSSELFDLSPALAKSASAQATPNELTLASEIDPSTRALTAILRPRVVPEDWRSGMLLTVMATEFRKAAAVTIPPEAVVSDQGMSTAYVMLDGEKFQRRVLKLGNRDSERVEVLSGIAAGERVVTRGAHFVRLASMAPEGFGHGHAH